MNTNIDTAITNYLPLLSKAQKEAILTVMKTFTQELPGENYNEAIVNEINSRFADYEDGKTLGYTLEETENRARSTYATKKNK